MNYKWFQKNKWLFVRMIITICALPVIIFIFGLVLPVVKEKIVFIIFVIILIILFLLWIFLIFLYKYYLKSGKISKIILSEECLKIRLDYKDILLYWKEIKECNLLDAFRVQGVSYFRLKFETFFNNFTIVTDNLKILDYFLECDLTVAFRESIIKVKTNCENMTV